MDFLLFDNTDTDPSDLWRRAHRHEESVTVFGCRKFYMWEFRAYRLSDSDSLLWYI